VRYRDWKSSDLDRARAAVAAWRDEDPEGNADQLIADIAGQFHPDYAVVLRGVLWAVDHHRARQVTGVVTGPAEAGR
jgi:hypothetical protein